jgi:predicted small lipoprotein YifL
MTIFRMLCVLMLAGLLVACGQRGPLYLPEDSPPAATSQDDGNELEEDPEHEDEVHSGSFEDGQPN